MQPYQKSSKVTRESGERILDAAKYAGATAIGSGVATVASKSANVLLNKIGSFLSPYISEDIAVKGLSKVDPRVGKFVKNAMANGADFEEIRSFIGDKISNGPKNNSNIIEQESPELHQFIKNEIKKGRKPLEAANIAKLDKQRGNTFRSSISKLEKSHKTPWAKIVQDLYGQGDKALPPEEQSRRAALGQFNNRLKKGLVQQETERFEQGYGEQPEQNMGQGQQALMGILQKINQRLGQ